MVIVSLLFIYCSQVKKIFYIHSDVCCSNNVPAYMLFLILGVLVRMRVPNSYYSPCTCIDIPHREGHNTPEGLSACFSVAGLFTPAFVYIHASARARQRHVVFLCTHSLIHQVLGLEASDVGGGPGGNNNNRARCCPVSIAASSGPCCLGPRARPRLLSSPVQSGTEALRDGRGGPPAAA